MGAQGRDLDAGLVDVCAVLGRRGSLSETSDEEVAVALGMLEVRVRIDVRTEDVRYQEKVGSS